MQNHLKWILPNFSEEYAFRLRTSMENSGQSLKCLLLLISPPYKKAQRGKWKIDEHCALTVEESSVSRETLTVEELSSTKMGKTPKFIIKIFLKLFPPEAIDFEVHTLSIPSGAGEMLSVLFLSVHLFFQQATLRRYFLLPGDLSAGGRFLCMQEAHKKSSQTAAFLSHSQKSSSFAADVFLPFFTATLSAYTAESQSHWFSVNREVKRRGMEKGKAKRETKQNNPRPTKQKPPKQTNQATSKLKMVEGKFVIFCNFQQAIKAIFFFPMDTCVGAITFLENLLRQSGCLNWLV